MELPLQNPAAFYEWSGQLGHEVTGSKLDRQRGSARSLEKGKQDIDEDVQRGKIQKRNKVGRRG